MDPEKQCIQSNQDVHVCEPIYVVDIWWKWYENIVELVEKVKTWWKHNSTLAPWKHTSLLEFENTC
jgi:hypothetical protein